MALSRSACRTRTYAKVSGDAAAWGSVINAFSIRGSSRMPSIPSSSRRRCAARPSSGSLRPRSQTRCCASWRLNEARIVGMIIVGSPSFPVRRKRSPGIHPSYCRPPPPCSTLGVAYGLRQARRIPGRGDLGVVQVAGRLVEVGRRGRHPSGRGVACARRGTCTRTAPYELHPGRRRDDLRSSARSRDQTPCPTLRPPASRGGRCPAACRGGPSPPPPSPSSS